MLPFYNDSTIKIEYNPETNKTVFDLNTVGTDSGESIDVYSGITPTDSNSIFVSDTAGNDSTGDGTGSLPYKTILKGINSCTVDKIYIIILDSATYAEDLTTVSNIYFSAIYADTAQTPILSRRVLSFTPTDSNSIFVNGTTGNDSTGDGSSSNPYKTITVGSSNCDATHQKVVIQDSSTYTDSGLEFTGNFLGLYADIGQTPIVNPDTSDTFFDDRSITKYIDGSIFETGGAVFISSSVFSDDNILIAYGDSDDSGKGKFIIYNSLGVEQVSTTTFGNGSGYASTCILSNDNFVIAYDDLSDSIKGKFVIYNSSGVEQVSEVTFESGETSFISIVALSNDDFVIIYTDVDDSSKGKFVIYNSSGVEQVSPTVFSSGTNTIREKDIAVFSNDNFVISFYDQTDSSNKGKFVIYNSSGVEQVSEVVYSSSGVYNSTSVLSNDNFVIAYNDTSDSTKGKFVIYNSSGVEQVSEVTFETGTTAYISIDSFSNDDFLIAYRDSGDSGKGKFTIYTSSGVERVSTTEFETNVTRYVSVSILSNDNFLISYRDEDESGAGKFSMLYSFSYYLILVSASTEINGIIFDADNEEKKRIMFEATDELTLNNCVVKNVKPPNFITGFPSYAIESDSPVNLNNCSIFDGGAGVVTSSVTSVIQNSIFYNLTEGYAIDIDGSAVSSGDITIEHCTLYQNNGGIRLQNNNGSNEIVKNNIIHNNDNLGIYADTTITYSYSTNTDSVTGATAGSSVLLANPLFINDGSIDTDDTDLNLRFRLLGFTTDSPAYQLADDSRDAGAYNVIIIGSATSWDTITLYKPFNGVKVWTDVVSPIKNVRRDGSLATSREALTEYVELNYKGVSNADYIKMLSLLQESDSTVRIYPDPVTNPSDYNTYKFIYNTLQGSSAHYKLTRTGKEGQVLLFARATE